jgi:hypothetical protein
VPPPKGYEPYLGRYGVVVTDGGVSIGWGFPVIRQMSEEMFRNFPGCPVLVSYKSDLYFSALRGESIGNWVFVTRWLTPQESLKNYGQITKVSLGPRGGWRSVTYGTTTFFDKRMDPRGIISHPEPIYGN